MPKKNVIVSIGRRFFLNRKKDQSKVSGCGYVAFGVQFPSGKVVLEWLSEHTSEGIYENLEDCIKIHGHEGSTEVLWIDNVDMILDNKK